MKVGATYSDLGASAEDYEGNELSVHTSLNGEEVDQVNIDTSTTTEYEITYRATDTHGHTTEAIRTVIVQDPAPANESEPADEPEGEQATTTPSRSSATTTPADNQPAATSTAQAATAEPNPSATTTSVTSTPATTTPSHEATEPAATTTPAAVQ